MEFLTRYGTLSGAVRHPLGPAPVDRFKIISFALLKKILFRLSGFLLRGVAFFFF